MSAASGECPVRRANEVFRASVALRANVALRVSAGRKANEVFRASGERKANEGHKANKVRRDRQEDWLVPLDFRQER